LKCHRGLIFSTFRKLNFRGVAMTALGTRWIVASFGNQQERSKTFVKRFFFSLEWGSLVSEGHARQCCVWLHSLENQFNDCPCRRACFSTPTCSLPSALAAWQQSLYKFEESAFHEEPYNCSQSSFLERFCLKVTFEFLKVLRASDFRVSVLPSFSAHCWTFFQYLLVCLLSQQTFRAVKQKRFTWAHFMMTWFTTRLQLNKKDTKVDSPQLVLSLEPPHSRTWEAFVFARKRETDYCESSAVRELSKEKLWSRELLSKKRRHKRFKKGLCKDSTVKGERTKTRIPRVEVLPALFFWTVWWNTGATNFQLNKLETKTVFTRV